MNDLLWIGSSVHQRRLELGLTQGALARMAGVSRATVNGLERGSLANLSLGRLGLLLQVEAAAVRGGVPAAKVWRHIGVWARLMRSPRKEW
jgi:transcriptional regulator with XRE-family HTH domain